MSELKIPGKLMLAGEYAVTLANHLALVFSIDRFISKNYSQLVNEKGVKYGLGSSGAYAVLMTKMENSSLSDKDIFRQALILSRQTQPQNSGADIAASTYSGLLLYKNGSFPERIFFPENWNLIVGWTGKPAITSELVKKNQLLSSFVKESDMIVRKMVDFIKAKDFEKFNQEIFLAEKNLEKLSGVLTDKLAKAIEIAKNFGIEAKISGAGGGDNVIAFTRDPKISQQIKNNWQEAGIIPLDLHVYYKK
ncbi:mevalonate kinase [Oenococcus oeni]|uniref:mevalonate kinase family protein n=1 Tax=Oenococcus oeni TaxID=1247 RepID=UPI00050DD080|nr:kinase [Oenococcus oeni]KGH54279.1 kinase [Oenococcus oeni S11]MDS0176022.1 kinase [Oenococcus oeni]